METNEEKPEWNRQKLRSWTRTAFLFANLIAFSIAACCGAKEAISILGPLLIMSASFYYKGTGDNSK